MSLDLTPNQQKRISGTCGQAFALMMEIWSWTGDAHNVFAVVCVGVFVEFLNEKENSPIIFKPSFVSDMYDLLLQNKKYHILKNVGIQKLLVAIDVY